MFLEALEKDLGSVDDILAAGEIRKITRWLNENIHWHGSLRLPKEVIEKVCQKELQPSPFSTILRINTVRFISYDFSG